MHIENLNFSFIQMWYFIQIVEFKSYSKAAKNLNVSQSTLSKSIQTLEQNLNLQLFIRNKKNLVLTDAGRTLHKSWKSILNNVEESLELARNYAGANYSTLRIGVLDSHRSESYLLDYLARFHKLMPSCNVCIESVPPETLRKKLQNHEFDLIFTVRYDVETDGWDGFHIHIFEECPLALCMFPNNSLAAKNAVEVEDLKSCNLIVISSLHVPSYNIMLTELCRKHGFRPNIVYNTTNANSQIFNLQNVNDVFICDHFHRDYNSDKIVSKTILDTESGVAMVWNPQNKKKALHAFLSMYHI